MTIVMADDEFARVWQRMEAEDEGQNDADVSFAFTMASPKGSPLRFSQLFDDRLLDLDFRMGSPRKSKPQYKEFPSPGGGRGVRVYPERKRVQAKTIEVEVKEKRTKRVVKERKEKVLKVKRKKFVLEDVPAAAAPASVVAPAAAPAPVTLESAMDCDSLVALLAAATMPDPEPEHESEKRKAIVDRPALKEVEAKPWLQSDVGSRFFNIWKQVYCRNATSEFKLSSAGLRAASALVNDDGKLINGKHWRFDEARTMEHLQRIIDTSTLNGGFLLCGDQPFCVPLIMHLVVSKMFKSRGYQIRSTNQLTEAEYVPYENTRKASGYVETGEMHVPKAGRSAKDRMAVEMQKLEIKQALTEVGPVLYDVPPMADIMELCRRKLNMPVEQMIEAARGWRWGEVHTAGSYRLLGVANIVAMYCSLSNKARSFGLSVGPVCAVPLPMGP